MTRERSKPNRTVEVAEQVYDVLRAAGIESAVIGAMALAVHGYVRSTRDLDLATCTDPFLSLREATERLTKAGLECELRLPDADDPLGGVLVVTGRDFRPIEVVNFHNPLCVGATALADEAIRGAQRGAIEGCSIPVVDLPHLVALKLYGGGPKSRNDVIELLERNRPLDVERLRDVCSRHGLLPPLEAILTDLG